MIPTQNVVHNKGHKMYLFCHILNCTFFVTFVCVSMAVPGAQLGGGFESSACLPRAVGIPCFNDIQFAKLTFSLHCALVTYLDIF